MKESRMLRGFRTYWEDTGVLQGMIYVLVLVNSVSGLQIAGISVNTVVNLCLSVVVFFYFLLFREKKSVKTQTLHPYFLFFFAAAISCAYSMTQTYELEHYRIVRSFLINSVAYLVLFVLLYHLQDGHKQRLVGCYRKAVVFSARVQAIWGILQIILLYGCNFNINKWLFNDILHSSNTRDWVMGFYMGDTYVLRMSGLNYENSIFALILCMGIALEKNKWWKGFMALLVIFCLSRTGWVMLAVYYGIELLRWLKKKRQEGARLTWAVVRQSILYLFAGFGAGTLLYLIIPIVRRLVDSLYLRVTHVGALQTSAFRHIMYYPYGVKLWFEDGDLMQKLFGWGMRCSGIPFSENDAVKQALKLKNLTQAWTVECDVIGLLLGGGIVAFVLYYWLVYVLMKKRNEFSGAIFMILIGGITYHYHSISFILLFFLIAAINLSTEKRDNGVAVKEEAGLPTEQNEA